MVFQNCGPFAFETSVSFWGSFRTDLILLCWKHPLYISLLARLKLSGELRLTHLLLDSSNLNIVGDIWIVVETIPAKH